MLQPWKVRNVRVCACVLDRGFLGIEVDGLTDPNDCVACFAFSNDEDNLCVLEAEEVVDYVFNGYNFLAVSNNSLLYNDLYRLAYEDGCADRCTSCRQRASYVNRVKNASGRYTSIPVSMIVLSLPYHNHMITAHLISFVTLIHVPLILTVCWLLLYY